MARALRTIAYQVVELGGIRYAILPEAALGAVCKRCGLQALPELASAVAGPGTVDELDGAKLAEHLIRRREGLRLTQAELARRAGIRIETLNRIERGKTTPDFTTIRKLVTALKDAELQAVS